MALEKLALPNTFLEWCDKTNLAIDLLNTQVSSDALNLLTTVSKVSLVAAINELNDKKLDKIGGTITESLQVNGSLDVKNNISVGSSSSVDSFIRLYDSKKLRYKNFGWSSEKNQLVIEDDEGNLNPFLSSNSIIDLNDQNIDILNKRTTSNIIKNTTAKEGQFYYSQDEKRMYFFDGVTKGGFKLPIETDIGNTDFVKVSQSDTAGYLKDKIISDSGLKVQLSGAADDQKIYIQSNTIVGEVKLYAGIENSIPLGWIKCDGRNISRTTYKELFTKIGTIYGAGDGVNTFTLPNMNGRVPIGQGDGYQLGNTGGEVTHKLTVTEIPEHKHIAPFSEAYGQDPWGLVSKGHYGSNGGRDYDNWWAYTSPVGGNQPHNNMQPYITMFYIIFTGVY